MQLLNNQTKSANQHSLKSERMKWSCNRRKCTLRSVIGGCILVLIVA